MVSNPPLGSATRSSYRSRSTCSAGTAASPDSIARTSSTQFRAQISQGSRPSSRQRRGVPPYHHTKLSSHQSTRARDAATARPSRDRTTKRAAGNTRARRGIRRLFAIRFETTHRPPPRERSARNAAGRATSGATGAGAGPPGRGTPGPGVDGLALHGTREGPLPQRTAAAVAVGVPLLPEPHPGGRARGRGGGTRFSAASGSPSVPRVPVRDERDVPVEAERLVHQAGAGSGGPDHEARLDHLSPRGRAPPGAATAPSSRRPPEAASSTPMTSRIARAVASTTIGRTDRTKGAGPADRHRRRPHHGVRAAGRGAQHRPGGRPPPPGPIPAGAAPDPRAALSSCHSTTNGAQRSVMAAIRPSSSSAARLVSLGPRRVRPLAQIADEPGDPVEVRLRLDAPEPHEEGPHRIGGRSVGLFRQAETLLVGRESGLRQHGERLPRGLHRTPLRQGSRPDARSGPRRWRPSRRGRAFERAEGPRRGRAGAGTPPGRRAPGSR
ncbi:MAG: hypothetical protein KatS3mg014_1662 [Actinomycetota bacterium]|nr:MAG: hypothetical protein KatS3mg014_1662 [Actinomycetota bacterium]